MLKEVDVDDLNLRPKPRLERIQACLEEAAAFFHAQLETPIDENIEWNETKAYEEGYRKPETAREYFGTPDTDPIPIPLEQDPEALENQPAHRDEQHSGVIPTADAKADDRTPEELAADDQPYAYLGTDHRGWPDETIDDKQLGWAPIDTTALFDHLQAHGFEHHTMVATGLFARPSDAGGKTDNNREWVDYTTQIDDDEEPDPLKCLFCARYVFPYYDEHNRVTFLIGRKVGFDTEHGIHENDFLKGKYIKLAMSKGYSAANEPIYGQESIVDGEPLVITEGIADAISAHAHGIPCISPVTTTVKTELRDKLSDMIQSHGIPDVHFIQDADPPETSIPAEDDLEYDEEACKEALNTRLLFSPTDLPADLTADQIVDAYQSDELGALLEEHNIATDPEDVPVHILTDDPSISDSGPISEVLTIGQDGPGVKSAVQMGQILDAKTPDQYSAEHGDLQQAASIYEDHVVNAPPEDHPTNAELDTLLEETLEEIAAEETEDEDEANPAPDTDGKIDVPSDYEGTNIWVTELPQFGDEKRDLDDYLQEGWLSIMPPAQFGLWSILETFPATPSDGPTQPADWLASLTSDEEPVRAYPSKIDPTILRYPPIDSATPETYGSVKRDCMASSSAVYNPITDTEQLATLAQQGLATTPYHHASLFGTLPSLTPGQHPASALPPTGGQSGTDLNLDPQELEDRIESNEWQNLTGSHNPLWSATLRDLGFTPGFRGKNPFGHHGESENYFVVYDDDKAYCFKNNVLYNFLNATLVEIGERHHANAEGSLSDREKFLVWKYARTNGIVPAHTPLPIDSLVWYGLENDLVEESQLERWDTDDTDGDETNASNAAPKTKFPYDNYTQTLEHIEEHHGVTPARLVTLREGDSSSDNHSGNEDSPKSDTMSWDDALLQYGSLHQQQDDSPEPLQQFLNFFVEIDTDVDEPKESDLYIPTEQFREAYYTWVDLVNEYTSNTDGIDYADVEKKAPNILGRNLNENDDVSKSRRRIDGPLTSCYIGICLNSDGNKLSNLTED
ncbi:hypothetical protein D8Y22_05430 [Salinadaptatus halalkaliphilus]|uniref:Toprim domain-containing protein n=2 Tax=Salinadaptatus halalkaliphilus TaxID=2419781 RepID=A0A4S3TNQ8_9EURY|nr:hypothetical protein D8Y22_05430 [Salinadaptatus halalkaliphilus]